MAECWVLVQGWEDIAEVSNYGRVRRVRATRNHKAGSLYRPATAGRYGYKKIQLWRGGHYKQVYLHTLVLTHFGPPRPVGHEPDHRDRNPANNHINNLTWKTHKDNCANRRNGPPVNAKLTASSVRGIRNELAARNLSQRQIAKRFGVSPQTITLIKQERIWQRYSA